MEQALGERMALMNDLQNLVAASPAVIYTTKATDDYACTFVSENLLTTMGYAPWEMRDDPKFWSKRVHPDDAHRDQFRHVRSDRQGDGAIEYRFRHRRGHYIWVQDTLHGHIRQGRSAEGTGRLVGGHFRPQEDRGRAEAGRRRGRTAQSLHPRDIWPLSSPTKSSTPCSNRPPD